MSNYSVPLDNIADNIHTVFRERDKVREKVIPLCREAIHSCSITIRAVHRQEFDKAKELLKTASELLSKAKKATDEFKELAGAGYLKDAEKEYVEASVLIAIVTGQPWPGPTDLNVDPSSYLNGLGDTAGELRRYLLDGIRSGNMSRGEELLSIMDDIYTVLVTMDFPDAITGGLRRTTDMVRGVLEKTRSDLTLIIQQKSLETRLDEFEGKLK